MDIGNMQVEIDKLKAQYNQLLPMKQEDLDRLWRKFQLEWDYNSNHIEGNTLTYAQTELVVIFGENVDGKSLREIDEMRAHDVAVNMVKEAAHDKERPLTETFIKQLNEVILVRPYWKDAETADGQKTRRLINVGDYKEFPNHVRLSTGEIFYYATAEETPAMMGDLMNFYKANDKPNEIPPLWLAAMMHYKFVRIHPFDDGNGRIARLLMNYILLRNGLPPVIIKSSDKNSYLTALHKADAGDLESFIAYIGQQLLWSLRLSIKAAKGEVIEEENDIIKEIEIWKKYAAQNTVDGIHRNDELVYELYNNGIKEMFEQFAQRHQRFNDMFQKAVYNTLKNSSGRAGIEWLNEEIDQIVLKPKAQFLNPGEAPELIAEDDTFRNIFIQINFQEYKYGTNAFSINPILKIDFDPYKYIVHYSNKKIEKNYGEFLNEDERKQIIVDSVKRTFEDIKKMSK